MTLLEFIQMKSAFKGLHKNIKPPKQTIFMRAQVSLLTPVQNSTFHFSSSQISRLQRHLSAGEHQQDLFQSQPPIFISQHSQPPTQSLVELIQLCGGTVSRTVRQAGICIGRYSGRRPEGSRILSEQWVLGEMLFSYHIVE